MPDETSELNQTTTYTFKYGGESDSMDLNTLLLSQMHFSWVIGEIKNEVAPGAKLSLKIRPLEKGSIPFDFILNISWLESLFSSINTLTAVPATIISVWAAIVQFKKWSKGKKFTKVTFLDGGRVIVTIGDRDHEVNEVAYRLSKKKTIDTAITKGFEAIEKDENIESIEVLDQKREPILDIPRAEFADITQPNENFEEATTIESRQERLSIFKLVFDKGYKWQFYSATGRKINAIVKDDAFIERINKGESFAKGDVLVAEIEVEKTYDDTLNLYLESDFIVTKVIEHIPRVNYKQSDLYGMLPETGESIPPSALPPAQ